jgi:hypothetical protein
MGPNICTYSYPTAVAAAAAAAAAAVVSCLFWTQQKVATFGPLRAQLGPNLFSNGLKWAQLAPIWIQTDPTLP